MILFSPNGALNVAQDASELPETAEGNTIMSGAMVRCKNLRIDQKGIAKTRDGSAKLNATAINTAIWWIEEQGGFRHTFAGTAIYRDESSIATGLTSAQWAAIKYNAYNATTQNIFALNGTDRKRIENGVVYEWGLAAPTVAPTIAVGQGAGLTGEYNVKYTYLRKVGSVVVAESDPSPAATKSVKLNGQSLAVSVTQPTDTQVTHIRLYRTLADGGVYYFDQDIAVNFAYEYGYTYDWEEEDAYISGDGYLLTTEDDTHSTQNLFSWEERHEGFDTASFEFSDEVLQSIRTFLIGGNDIWFSKAVADGTATTDAANSVGNPVYSQPFDTFDSTQADSGMGDLLETDHDRPPLGSFVFGPAYDGTCFILKDNLLHYCKPKQPEYWPSLYFIEVSVPQFPLKTGVFHNGQPYVFSKIEIFYIQGTGHGTFFPLPMKAKTGAQSIRGAVSIAGKGIYHTGPDGIYLFSSGNDTKITEEALEPLFRGEDAQGMPGVADMSTSFLYAFKNRLYFGYRSAGYSYPTNVLVMNLDTGRIAYYTYNDGAAIEIRTMATDHENDRILIGDNSGYVRVIEEPAYTDDSGTAIPFEVQDKDFELQTRKHFPRWVKYDVDASSAASCTGSLLLDGVVHQTHTLNENRNTRRRLVDTGNGNRIAHRISGTGQVSIYAVESE